MHRPFLGTASLATATLGSLLLLACSGDDTASPLDAGVTDATSSLSDAQSSYGDAPATDAGAPDARAGTPDGAPEASTDLPEASVGSVDGASDAALPSHLDPTFAEGGAFALPATTLDGVAGELNVHSIVARADGRLVVAGLHTEGHVVTQLTADGTAVDRTFGTNGVVTLSPEFWPTAFNWDGVVALQTDGKIVVGYACLAPLRPATASDMCITRLNAGGDIDTTFGDSAGDAGARTGTAQFSAATDPTAAESDTITAIALDGAGHVVFGGTGGKFNGIAGRLTADGVLDSSFNGGAIVVLPFAANPYGSSVAALGLTLTGRILFASNCGVDVVALTAGGVIDSTFASSAVDAGAPFWCFSADGTSTAAMIVAPDDSVVMAGLEGPQNQTQLVATKLTNSGELDEGFGAAGVVVAPIPSGYAFSLLGGAAALGGSFYVAGSLSEANGDRTEIVWKLSTSGVPDSTYGPSGLSSAIASTDVSALTVQGSDLVTAGVVYGINDSSISETFVVERILP